MGSKETPRLSPSIAHKLVTESPLEAWAAHRMLGNRPGAATLPQVAGRMWHSLLLDGGQLIEVIGAKDFKTKAAQEARDAAFAAGKIPVPEPKLDTYRLQAAVIRREIERAGIELSGPVEQRVEWKEFTEDGNSVLCSGFIDHAGADWTDDLKTTEGSVSDSACINAIARSHALLQMVAYHNAAGRPVRFVFAQTREPFAVNVKEPSGEFMHYATLRWKRAKALWDRCLSAGTHRENWPGPANPRERLAFPPAWLAADEIAREEAA